MRPAAVLGLVAFMVLGVQWRLQQSIPPAARAAAEWDNRLAIARRVDVNHAGASELARLPGIGPELARRIVEDRQAHGAFERVEALQRVRGIGPRTAESLRDHLVMQ